MRAAVVEPGDQGAAVHKAAAEYRGADRVDEADSREFVDQADRWADELPALAKRTGQSAVERPEMPSVPGHGRGRPRLPPGPTDGDPRRTNGVLIAAGRAAAAHWVLTTPDDLSPADKQLITDFRQLSNKNTPATGR